MATNQDKLNDVWWILAANDGREFLEYLMKGAVREVLAEPAVLDSLALAVLKRDCDLIDPTGKTDNVDPVRKTTLASKIKWQANLEAKAEARDLALLKVIAELSAKVDALTPKEA